MDARSLRPIMSASETRRRQIAFSAWYRGNQSNDWQG